ncbi:hypothetical protein L1987_13149 [Smallanthus sonchifolius]|uniref:Uncharacterized protein n=1 Tax=Smallanthus sonchifolius TaxID=185202 RepID=A0ACB9JG48_9ASTR|nr:hypothetical protein L1987_13149 [Smallanthus sonchifolius]
MKWPWRVEILHPRDMCLVRLNDTANYCIWTIIIAPSNIRRELFQPPEMAQQIKLPAEGSAESIRPVRSSTRDGVTRKLFRQQRRDLKTPPPEMALPGDSSANNGVTRKLLRQRWRYREILPPKMT